MFRDGSNPPKFLGGPNGLKVNCVC